MVEYIKSTTTRSQMINIDSMCNEYDLLNSTGNDIDSFFTPLLYTFLDQERRMKAAFEFITRDHLLWKKIAADANLIFKSADYIISEFVPTNDFPFYRLYCYNYNEANLISYKALSSNLRVEEPNDLEIMVRYMNPKINNKVDEWIETQKKLLAPSETIANGRLKNTIVDQTIIIHRQPNGCVICGGKSDGYVSSTLSSNKTILYIANTCKEHQALAKEHPTFLHFIFDLFQIGEDLFSFQKLEKIPEKLIGFLSEKIANTLNAKQIDKRYDAAKDETTITFERDTGFKIILRLKNFMDYAYIINKPNGKQFQRIDSAPDHKNIEFFPDHIHLTPKKDNSNVESSYTYGFPLLDLPAIQKMLEDGEK